MQEYLKELGFTSGEQKVYLALLKLRSATAGPIAKEAGVSRSKLYEILEKLSKKGIIGHLKRNNIRHFTANHPRRILDYLKDKEENIKQKKFEFQKALPYFESFIGQPILQKEAEVFEGMEGIKNIRENILKKMKPGEHIYQFGNSESGHKDMLGYWDDFTRRRVQKKVWSSLIYNQDGRKYAEQRRNLPYTKVRYLPKKGPTPAWVAIFGDSVAIAIKLKTPMTIVINNKLVAKSFKMYFDILWDSALEDITPVPLQ